MTNPAPEQLRYPSPDRSACRVCGATLRQHQTITVRGADAELLRCADCGLFEFPDPTWLDAAYADPIADIDVGLASRSVAVAAIVEAIVRSEGLGDRMLLDYGGGWGLLTRLCRDRGLDMRHHEPYAPNLFAPGLDAELDAPYACATLIEVLEHLTNPLEVLSSLRDGVELIIVTTQLVPPGMTDLRDWFYLIPELGQHITFYTEESLRRLGLLTGYHLVSDGSGLHVFSKRRLSARSRMIVRRQGLANLAATILRRRCGAYSLAQADTPIAFASQRAAGAPIRGAQR